MQRTAVDEVAARVASVGEPFRSAFEPVELVGRVREQGFENVRDLGPTELNEGYFGGRADGLRVGGTGHVVAALG